MPRIHTDHDQIIELLRTRGPLGGVDLGRAIAKSQPSVSRLVRALSATVVPLAAGKRTRYGLAAAIAGLPSHQPLQWTDEAGRIERLGSLDFLADDWLHVATADLAIATRAQLPWFLAPLRVQGFLGRERARALAGIGFDHDPERWTLEQQLHVIVRHLADPPGAISVGEPIRAEPTRVPARRAERLRAYDRLAADVASTLPAGSSAAGEQAKFLACIDGRSAADPVQHVLVKFSPPADTPFGERWRDLLHAEALALALLTVHGIDTAHTQVESTPQRTVLVSERFDRIGEHGRRHVVALTAIHDAFVPGPRQHWAATCDALARQRRLPEGDASKVRDLLAFGRLIGNSDMHFGNLSMFVERRALATGRFTLAPLYDMLPMHWRPDPTTGALDTVPFEPMPVAAASPALAWAAEFWGEVAASRDTSATFRSLARAMGQRVRGVPG